MSSWQLLVSREADHDSDRLCSPQHPSTHHSRKRNTVGIFQLWLACMCVCVTGWDSVCVHVVQKAGSRRWYSLTIFLCTMYLPSALFRSTIPCTTLLEPRYLKPPHNAAIPVLQRNDSWISRVVHTSAPAKSTPSCSARPFSALGTLGGARVLERLCEVCAHIKVSIWWYKHGNLGLKKSRYTICQE
jgi:hypothetical protein